MAFIPLLDCWRVALSYQSLGGNNAANVIYFRDEVASMTGIRAQQVADEVRNWVGTEWLDVASDQWTCQTIDVVDAGSQTGASATNGSPTTGLVGFDPLPSQDTVAISLRTGAMGRSNRGRLYHVGLTEGDIADGLLTPTIQTALIAAYTALIGAMAAEDLRWVVASFYTAGAPRIEGETRYIENIVIVDNKVDRQIRRKK